MIQNFNNNTSAFKVTIKYRLFNQLTNTHLIYHLLQLQNNFYSNSYFMISNWTIPTRVLLKYFHNFNQFFPQSFLKSKKIFWRYNMSPSLRYWFINHLLKLTKGEKYSPLNTNLKNQLVHNQYLMPIFVSNISLHNSLFKPVLLQFLLFFLTNWTKVNKNFSLTLNFLIINKIFFICRFLNKKLFKVYSL